MYSVLLPVMFRLLPMVTPSNVPFTIARLGVASVLITVPPMMVPDSELSPPLPNTPALPTSSVPLLVNVPVRLMVLPLPRVKVPRLAVEIDPLRFKVVPLATVSAPVLLRLVPVMVSVPPCVSITPVAPLLQLVAFTFKVPAVTRNVPLLVSVLGLML